MKIRWHWGTAIAAVYVGFAAATVAFVVFAAGQRVELVSADYYQRALEHDRRMAAVANAAGLGAAFRIEPSADGGSVALVWTQARPEKDAGTVTLYRASDAAFDRRIALAPGEDGRQTIALAGLPSGRWLVQVQWRAGGREFYAEQAVVAR